jgi:hypothetical protein
LPGKKNEVGKTAISVFYKGLFRKRDAEGWFFVVKNVVKGVIKLERYTVFRGEGKYATYFRFIFWGRHDL